MNYKILIAILFTLSTLTSCSTMKSSISLGTTIGAASGTLIGSQLGHGSRKIAMRGLAIGALIGGIGSYFLHKELDKRDANVRRETIFNLEKYDVYRPTRASYNSTSSQYEISPSSAEQDYIEEHQAWPISEDSQWIPNERR